MEKFIDRSQAGQQLAAEMRQWQKEEDVIVLGLPRGGVPVAFEIAKELQLPLDIYLVRKLGVPGQPELAMGAIGSGGVKVLNQEIIQNMEITKAEIDQAVEKQMDELSRREQAYRGDRPRAVLSDKTVILVDDGIATGATLKAALQAVQKQDPRKVIAAVPVAPTQVVEELRPKVEAVICLHMTDRLHSIGLWYEHFDQVEDVMVRELLAEARQAQA